MDIFNNLQVINDCLFDAPRTAVFEKAIKSIIKPEHTVLDAGTGTGILAMLSARAGAKKVYAVDIAEDTIQQATQNVISNNFQDKITLIRHDLKDFNEIPTVDVLTMEMLDTGLISEQQAIALNHLRKNKIIDEHTILIPNKAECYIEAIDYDYDFYGFEMRCIIQARDFQDSDREMAILSEPILYRDIDFKKQIDRDVDVDVQIPILKDGYCNALRLKTRTALTDKIDIWGTADMNMPVVLPITPRKVTKGDIIKAHIKYSMGEGFANFRLTTE
jgi:predicted RNA methylase